MSTTGRCPCCDGPMHLVPARPIALRICQSCSYAAAAPNTPKSVLPAQPVYRSVQPPKAQRPVREVILRAEDGAQ